MPKVGSVQIDFEARLAKWTSGIDRVQSDLRGVHRWTGQAGSALNTLRNVVTGFGAARAAARIADFASDVAEVTAQLRAGSIGWSDWTTGVIHATPVFGAFARAVESFTDTVTPELTRFWQWYANLPSAADATPIPENWAVNATRARDAVERLRLELNALSPPAWSWPGAPEGFDTRAVARGMAEAKQKIAGLRAQFRALTENPAVPLDVSLQDAARELSRRIAQVADELLRAPEQREWARWSKAVADSAERRTSAVEAILAPLRRAAEADDGLAAVMRQLDEAGATWAEKRAAAGLWETAEANRRLRELDAAARRWVDATMTPMQAFEASMAEINYGLERGILDWDQYDRAVERALRDALALGDAVRGVGFAPAAASGSAEAFRLEAMSRAVAAERQDNGRETAALREAAAAMRAAAAALRDSLNADTLIH